MLSTLTRCDNDNDGVVSVREVSQVCRTIGFNPPEAELQVGQTTNGTIFLDWYIGHEQRLFF